jgi:PAS domain S-box-containing protein
MPAQFLPGQNTDVLTFQQCAQVIHPDDRVGAVEHYRRCLDTLASSNNAESTKVPEITFRVCRSHGATRWVLVRGTVLRQGDGQPYRVLGTVTDISERREMEMALRESEQRLETIMDHSPLAMFLKDSAGHYLYVNPAFERDVQKTKENIIGKTAFEMFPHNEATAFSANDRQVHEAGVPQIFDETASRGDGPHTAIVHKFPLLDQQGRTHAIAGIVTDITERKRAEEQLREREEWLQMALEAGRMGVWDWEPITGRLTWSAEHFAIMGVEPMEADTLTYSTWSERVHPEDYPNAKESMEAAIAERKQYRCEYRVLRPDGSIRWVAAWGEPLFNQDGECVRVMGLVADITDRKRAEESLHTALVELEHLKERVEAENIYLRTELKLSRSPQFYGGESAAMNKIYGQIDQVAGTDMTVLILGETGAGKELVARAIHQASSRRDKPLVTVNCSALPADLVESELFGHEKGAFTNAMSRRLGRFELAHEGTLFLDEIGDLPLPLQAKLLRALQEGEFARLGSGKAIKVDVRVLAATNRDLGTAIKNGDFRTDLFYRLNVFPIHVPPLRERRQDIGTLARKFLEEASVRLGRAVPELTDELVRLLENHDWPGNVRELRNIIERAVLSSAGGDLRLPDDWNPTPGSTDEFARVFGSQKNAGMDQPRQDPQRTTLKDFERNHILQALEQTKWRIEGPKGAATLLGLRPSTLRSRMRKYGIQ